MSCSVCQGYNSDKCPCCGEGVRSVECPDCHGTGRVPYLALNILSNKTIEVSEKEWKALPDDEYIALAKGIELVQYEEGGFVCRTCYGDGKIPEDY